MLQRRTNDDGAPTTLRRGVIKLGHQTGNDGTVRCDDVEAASVAGVRLPQGPITQMVEELRTEPTSRSATWHMSTRSHASTGVH